MSVILSVLLIILGLISAGILPFLVMAIVNIAISGILRDRDNKGE